MSLPTVQQCLTAGIRQLNQANIANAAGDARRLMASALDVESDRLTLAAQDLIEIAAASLFESYVLRRADGEPVSRIIGGRWFYGRWFKISPHTLDPRPETEILIERALAEPFVEFLDLGTGTGCIAVTLLAERTDSTCVASDISPDALDIAGQNANLHGVSERLRLQKADWYQGISGKFDLIISNPPYISAHEVQALATEVKDHDPMMALTDHGDGLGAYRSITAKARDFLRPGGRILVEIGSMQALAVSALFETSGLSQIHVYQDFDGRDRVVTARNLGA